MQITLGLTLQNNNGNKTDIFFVIYCTNILLYSTYAAKFWLLLTGGGVSQEFQSWTQALKNTDHAP